MKKGRIPVGPQPGSCGVLELDPGTPGAQAADPIPVEEDEVVVVPFVDRDQLASREPLTATDALSVSGHLDGEWIASGRYSPDVHRGSFPVGRVPGTSTSCEVATLSDTHMLPI
jgi:hypothetical protein